MALELRPNCEGCDRDLPPAAEALICSYECTFCPDCVKRLQNVCPNCGGGFTPRPVRPAGEWRPGLSLAKRAVSSYLESERDLMHLTNVPSTLQSVAGGMSFLGIERGAAVLRACARYIEQRMLNSEQQPGMADLETLADAISSVDYFLESLEANKPIGDSILEIAEDSMAELGFPVESARAA